MRRFMMILSAAALLVTPAAVSAGDGQESRHWRDYPGAAWDVPSGAGRQLNASDAPATGYALQGPAPRSFSYGLSRSDHNARSPWGTALGGEGQGR